VLTLYDLNPDRWLSAWLAVKACKLCIHLWNEHSPDDSNLDNGIYAVERWLAIQSDDNAALVKERSKIVDKTEFDASPFDMRKRCAVAVIDVVLSTCDIVNEKQYLLAAGEAIGTAHHIMKDSGLISGNDQYWSALFEGNLEFIIDCNIRSNQSFGNFEKVFEAASDADKAKLLFHLDLNNA